MALTITPQHGFLVLSTGAICFYSLIAGGLYISGARSKAFSEAWSKTTPVVALAEEHKKAGLGDFPKNGYPDMGNGRFAATLSYPEWYAFNNAQRAHYNLVENISGALTLHVLSGLFFPVPTAASAVLWIAARHVWASNYVKSGPNARYGGIAGAHALCLLGWFGAAMAGGLRMAQVIKF